MFHDLDSETIGYVADFCKICHGITPNRIVKVYEEEWTDQGESHCWISSCELCETYHIDEPEDYNEIVDDFQSMQELMEVTFPDIEKEYKERLSLEKKIRDDPDSLKQEDRKRLIRESLENAAEVHRLNKDQFSEVKWISYGLGIGLYMGFGYFYFVLWIVVTDFLHSVLYQTIILAIGATGFGYILYIVYKRLFMDSLDQNVSSMLVRSLRVVKPSKKELTSELDWLKIQGFSGLSGLDVDQLLKDIKDSENREVEDRVKLSL